MKNGSKKLLKKEINTSWAKIIIAVIIGIIFGYLILGQNLASLSYTSITPLITLALLACVLALLLDIRKIILSKICP
jgi:drug/metabolite transporter (DMT)-like permease